MTKSVPAEKALIRSKVGRGGVLSTSDRVPGAPLLLHRGETGLPGLDNKDRKPLKIKEARGEEHSFFTACKETNSAVEQNVLGRKLGGEGLTSGGERGEKHSACFRTLTGHRGDALRKQRVDSGGKTRSKHAIRKEKGERQGENGAVMTKRG